jgi:hypothetical protein
MLGTLAGLSPPISPINSMTGELQLPNNAVLITPHHDSNDTKENP